MKWRESVGVQALKAEAGKLEAGKPGCRLPGPGVEEWKYGGTRTAVLHTTHTGQGMMKTLNMIQIRGLLQVFWGV